MPGGAGEVLVADTLQGAAFALVKAAVDRGAAEGTRKLTGVWPGDESRRHDHGRARSQSRRR
jgi:hypothetical protein